MHDGPAAAPARTTVVAVAVLLALVAVVYGPAAGHGWVFDDARFIVNNPHVLSPASWTAFVTDMHTTDPLSPRGIVRPLRTIDFAIDARLFGLSPAAFHVHSVLWFAAATLLLHRLLSALVGDARAALAGAALWAVHPMQTECVAWVSSRGDVACAALLFASLLAALRPGARWTAVSAGLALLAAGFKEVGVVAPLLVVLVRRVRPPGGTGAATSLRGIAATRGDPFDGGPEARPSFARTLVAAWPWFATSAVYLVYRGAVQVGDTTHIDTYQLGGSLAGTFSTMFRAFGAYVLFAVLPVRPALDWHLAPTSSLLAPSAVAWAIGHACLLGLGFRGMLGRTRSAPAGGWPESGADAGRIARACGVGLLWFYAALLPVTNWPFYLGIPTTERFLHVPLAGFAIGVAAVLTRAPRACGKAVWVAIVALAALSASRVPDWKDDTTLWPTTAADVDSPRGEGYMAAEQRKAAVALRRTSEADARATFEDALRHAHRAIELWARIEGTWHSRTHAVVEPHINASNICCHLGRYGEALFHADEANRIGDDLFPHSHYNRCVALLGLGRGNAAAWAAARAIEVGMRPDDDLRGRLMRAAELTEADGEPEVARYALLAAADSEPPASGTARAALRALASRVAQRTAALTRAAETTGDARALAALAIHRASAGEVAAADAIMERATHLRPDLSSDPAWIHARWAARGRPEGWRKAVELTEGSADPAAIWLRARGREELGEDAEALREFRTFLSAFGSDPPRDDSRIARARAAVERLALPCPDFGDEPLPLPSRSE